MAKIRPRKAVARGRHVRTKDPVGNWEGRHEEYEPRIPMVMVTDSARL